jgi:hypothetical protein
MPPREKMMIGQHQEIKTNEGNRAKNSMTDKEATFLFGTKIAKKISSTDPLLCGSRD